MCAARSLTDSSPAPSPGMADARSQSATRSPNSSRCSSPAATNPELFFVGAQGAILRPGNLRYRVMIPAAERAGVPWARCHTLRHTCAALLIDAGASPLRLQRWMGHHSAAFTLDNYGHLFDDGLGPSLDLSERLPAPAVAEGQPVA